MPKNTKPQGYVTGRPTVDLNPEEVKQVETMAAYLTHDQIAAVLGISDDTLRKIRRRREDVDMAIKKGKAFACERVAQSLIKNAVDKNNVLAQMFFLKCHGWVEAAPVHEHQTINISYSPARGRNERDVTPPVQNLEHEGDE